MKFEPMDRDILQKAMSVSIKEKLTDEAYEALTKAMEQATDHTRKTGYPIQDYLENNIERVSRMRGLIDNWLALISLSCYAVGIAEGQRRLEILAQDIERAKLKSCDEYPKCVPMMLARYRDALDLIGKIKF